MKGNKDKNAGDVILLTPLHLLQVGYSTSRYFDALLTLAAEQNRGLSRVI